MDGILGSGVFSGHRRGGEVRTSGPFGQEEFRDVVGSHKGNKGFVPSREGAWREDIHGVTHIPNNGRCGIVTDLFWDRDEADGRSWIHEEETDASRSKEIFSRERVEAPSFQAEARGWQVPSRQTT